MLDKSVVRNTAEPQPAPGQIKTKVAYCGICGTDIEILEGWFGPGRPQARPMERRGPRIIGHEASGTIVAVGSNVQGYRVGQRVA